MGQIPCCEKNNVKRGQWTPEEDNKLSSYIAQHGTRNWLLIPKNAGLQRCGKSCRLRWTNYLRPDLKHGKFSEAEEQTIMRLHAVVGNRWSLIAAQLPGWTDNDVKNYWNTKLKKKLSGMGIDPVTHKPFSHLTSEIATTLLPRHGAHLAEATLGCFKDEMLHLLAKKRVDFQLHHSIEPSPMKDDKEDSTMGQIKLGLSGAIQEHKDTIPPVISSKLWELPSSGNLIIGSRSSFPCPEYNYSPASFMDKGNGPPCTRRFCGKTGLGLKAGKRVCSMRTVFCGICLLMT